ncbi:arginine--tRNA ligase [bacterium]|nr:arginine--tRNA ligase [bacterium]
MKYFKQLVAEAIYKAVPELTINEIYSTIEKPEPHLGDFAFPCFKLAKVMRKSPIAIATDLMNKIEVSENIFRKESVGAYINFHLVNSSVVDRLTSLFQNQKLFSPKEKNGKYIAIDYSSPNIAKPIAFHHIRSTVIGNSIGNLFEFAGYNVARINYLGDWGTQFGKLITAFKKWGSIEALERDKISHLLEIYVKYHQEVETHPELDSEARAWFKKTEDGDLEALALWEKFREISLLEFDRVYRLLNIKFTHIEGESKYSKVLDETIEQISEKIETKISEGALIIPFEEMPPCLLKKMDGATLYATRDIAAAIDRFNRFNFEHSFYVVATQQELHFKQVFEVIKRMGFNWSNRLEHIKFGMVKGMSTRSGNLIFLEDVLNEAISRTKVKILEKERVSESNIDEVARKVGVGSIIFGDLKNGRVNDYDFDWEEILNFSGYSGPNAQYAYARVQSIIKKSDTTNFNEGDLNLLTDSLEINLMKKVLAFDEVIDKAVETRELHHITRFVYELAKDVASFHHAISVIQSENDLKKARVKILHISAECIKTALSILGIETVDSM